jgi:hypothetical protein
MPLRNVSVSILKGRGKKKNLCRYRGVPCNPLHNGPRVEIDTSIKLLTLPQDLERYLT